MRWRLPLAMVVLVLAAEVPAGADGTIDTAAATLTAGAAPATGAVVVDRCAPPNGLPALPSIPQVGTLGSLPGAMRAFPGGGAGSDGAFHATQEMTLPAGTYEYTSYTVDAGVLVHYDGPVTIRTTGDVSIDGYVDVTANGGPITLYCAGSMTFGDDGVLEIRFAPGLLDVAVAGVFTVGADSRLFGSGGLTLTLHGGGSVDCGTAGFGGGEGDVLVQSAGALAKSGGFIVTSTGDLTLEARDGDLDLTDTSLNVVNQVITVAASAGVSVSGTSNVISGRGTIRTLAYGGDLTVRDDVQIGTGEGLIEFRASGSVRFEDQPELTSTDATIDICAHGGDAVLVPTSAAGALRIATGSGAVSVRATGDVLVNGAATIESTSGSVNVEAPGGSVVFGGTPSIDVGGDATFRALDGVAGTGLDVTASGIDVAAGAQGVDLAFGANGAETTNTGVQVVAAGDVRLTGRVASTGDVSVASCDGDVVLANAQVTTSDRTGLGGTSGDVAIETFGGAPTTIDLAGATIATGASDNTSGGIDVLARHATALLPVRVRLTLPPGKRRRKPGLKLRGVLDTGPTDVDLMQPAVLQIGALSIDVPGLTAGRRRRLEHRTDTLLLRVTPPGSGSSRAKFELRLEQDLTGLVEPDGSLLLRYRTPELNARGRIDLAEGRFRLGRVPGTLHEPGLYLTKAKVRLRGEGRDAFKAAGEFAGPAILPETAPEVRIALGDGVDATIPAGDFARRGRRFVFRGDANGIRRVVLDYRRGRVTVAGRRAAFGDLVDGPQPLAFRLRLGTDERTVHVGAVRRGSRLKH